MTDDDIHQSDGSYCYTNPIIARAMQNLEAAIPEAMSNPKLPVYHFRSPGLWMGDINGPIYHKGYYHIFYQHNPYGSKFGNSLYWGHARSKDLIFWEHLPIALWPSDEKGERSCYSGCTVINDLGKPMIFYTSVSHSRPMEQWAAIGDNDLITWEKHPNNPILHESLHTERVKIGGWRDPFTFRYEGQTYMIVGGSAIEEDDQETRRGIVSLYQPQNADFTKWKYMGPLFYYPTSPDNACPNFFKVGDKWVLFASRHEPHVVNYFVGTWDPETLRFQSEFSKAMGYSEDIYATQGLYDAKGRLIIWGTMHSYRSSGWLEDWPSCQTLPRVVSLREDGLLSFEPLPELKILRGEHHQESDISLSSSSYVLENAKGDVLEIIVQFEPQDAHTFGINVRRSEDGSRSMVIRYDDQGLEADGKRGLFNKDDKHGPFKLLEKEKTLTLRIFLDKRAVEIYVNGRACFSRLIDPDANDLGIEVFAEGGEANVSSIDIWKMNSIW